MNIHWRVITVFWLWLNTDQIFTSLNCYKARNILYEIILTKQITERKVIDDNN